MRLSLLPRLSALVVGVTMISFSSAAPPSHAALTSAQREQLKERDRWAGELRKLQDAGKWDEATLICRKLLALTRSIRGEVHEEMAATWQLLAEVQEARGEFAAARAALEKVLDLQAKLHGPKHWQTTDARWELTRLQRRAAADKAQLQALAEGKRLHQRINAATSQFTPVQLRELIRGAEIALKATRGVYGDADPNCGYWLTVLGLFRLMRGDRNGAAAQLNEALDIQVKALGEMHPVNAMPLQMLGRMFHGQSDYARAEPMQRRFVQLAKEVWGEDDLRYALAINDLAVTCLDMGDLAGAAQLFRQSLRIRERIGKTEDRNYAVVMHNLAEVYMDLGQYEKAKQLFERVKQVCARTPEGREFLQDHNYLFNLSRLYEHYREYNRAEGLLLQSREIDRRRNGGRDSLSSLHNLGALYLKKGDYDRAEKLLRQVVEESGGNFPVPGSANELLAHVYFAKGNFADAERLLRPALRQLAEHVERTFVVQSEQQQLRMCSSRRHRLDFYLSLAPRLDAEGERAYQEMLSWKGMVFARQQQTSRARRRLSQDAEASRLFAELMQTVAALSRLSRTSPRDAQIKRLSERKETLEKAIGRRIPDYRRQHDLAGRTSVSIKAALPAEAVLFDLLEYQRIRPPRPGRKELDVQRCVTAFVVRRNRPVVQVDLGPAQEIAKAIDEWRRRAWLEATPQAADRGGELRRLLREPLQKYLEGVKLVLVSPDGATARLPWAALPGKTPGSYLVEEAAVAVVPVPALLPDLLESATAPAAPQSLLLVGDVRFGADAGRPTDPSLRRSAERGGERKMFGELPGSRDEVRAIGESFERGHKAVAVKLLSGEQATEEAVRHQSPRFRYLHFATHGFFTPPAEKSSDRPVPANADPLEAPPVYPGLLSGLVLAGANRSADLGQDDGILTAMEVAQLDLNAVELATLSACETGLGPSAGGEGLLGLQRAFQVAGARGVAASLWKVNDRTTRELMEAFYQNLWTKGLSKAEALRQAQRAMLAGGKQPGRRLPPYYWAAFVLSGDWR